LSHLNGCANRDLLGTVGGCERCDQPNLNGM
jgi:hypothetical protein